VWVAADDEWELLAPVPVNTVCFRASFAKCDPEIIDELNRKLMDRVNNAGKMYLTHTRLAGKFTLRLAIGQTATAEQHVKQAWDNLNQEMSKLKNEN